MPAGPAACPYVVGDDGLASWSDTHADAWIGLLEEAGLSLSRVSRIIDLLEARGLVRRQPCAEDARAVEAHITAEASSSPARRRPRISPQSRSASSTDSNLANSMSSPRSSADSHPALRQPARPNPRVPDPRMLARDD
jgi:hypothetical protein